jgi:predicted KAP-like P-loop ATPase
LAAAIAEWRGNDSLVIALYGTWGIGKSSIKNMLLEALKSESKEPHVVEYNPWQCTGSDQLASGFFSEIGRALKKGPDSKAARKREHAWRLYAARLGVPLAITDATRRIAAWALTAGGILGLLYPTAAAYLPRAQASAPVVIASTIMFLLAAVLTFAQGFFDRLANAASSRAAMLEQKSLTEEKAELHGLLAALTRPVLVVIDDIDRLRPSEIRLLFQLVKANADFPNLTYLLLFQRDIVESALVDTDKVGSGCEFLEKIVQVGFDVPPVETRRMYAALFSGLNQILEDEAVAKRFDNKHWYAVFAALRPLFGNLRDVARFLGSLSFHIALFRNRSSFEVNPVDLVALEAVRVFEPRVYARLMPNRPLLTSRGSQFGRSRDLKAEREALQSILDAATAENRDAVRDVLGALFPVVATLQTNTSFDGQSEAWFRSLRVCHEHLFERYFLLALPEDDISQADLDYLLDNAGNRSVISGRMSHFVRTGQIETVLNRLESYKQTLREEAIQPFITALMDVGDDLPERPAGMFAIGAELHASRFIHWSLKTISDTSKRAAVLREACLQSSGVLLPLREVAEQEAKENIAQSPESYFLNDDDIRICKAALVARIREHSTSNLESRWFLPFALFRWKEWGGAAEASEWIRSVLERPSGVASLLQRFLSKVTSTPMFGGPSTVHYRISLNAMRELVDIDAISSAIERLDQDALSEPERRAVTTFRRAQQREAEGKPEDHFDIRDD